MNNEIKQPTLEELCRYFWEIAKKYALTEQGKKEIASVEFILKSEMLMNRVGTIETALNQAEENGKALKIIFGEILNNSAFQIEIIEDSDACIIIKEYCLGNLLRDFKIPFDRRYIDLVKKVVKKYEGTK